jgi:hypothetical protein
MLAYTTVAGELQLKPSHACPSVQPCSSRRKLPLARHEMQHPPQMIAGTNARSCHSVRCQLHYLPGSQIEGVGPRQLIPGWNPPKSPLVTALSLNFTTARIHSRPVVQRRALNGYRRQIQSIDTQVMRQTVSQPPWGLRNSAARLWVLGVAPDCWAWIPGKCPPWRCDMSSGLTKCQTLGLVQNGGQSVRVSPSDSVPFLPTSHAS